MKNRKIENYTLKGVLLLIAIIPILYFNQIENVPLKAFILGAGSWGFGVIFKIIAHQLIVIPLQNKNKSFILPSFVNGFISGLFELFAAYFIIILMKDKFIFNYDAIISFGLAIGSLETILVVFSKDNDLLKGTSLEKSSAKLVEYLNNLQGIKHCVFNIIFPVIERVMATFIHISTRGLVFITIITSNVVPFLIALCVFIIVDGFLAYYYYVSGKLTTSKGYIKLYIYLLVITVAISAIYFVLMSPYRNIEL